MDQNLNVVIIHCFFGFIFVFVFVFFVLFCFEEEEHTVNLVVHKKTPMKTPSQAVVFSQF